VGEGEREGGRGGGGGEQKVKIAPIRHTPAETLMGRELNTCHRAEVLLRACRRL
jgi:hypothetical protein